jgi:uncharacterized protein YjbI with pentapeptide repeats
MRRRPASKTLICKIAGVDLTFAELEKALFSNADLSGLKGLPENCDDLDFSGARLDGLDLSGKSFRHSDFSGTGLQEANLSGTPTFQGQTCRGRTWRKRTLQAVRPARQT